MQIADEQIINVWLVGSRLHGIASPGSDYDFLVVIKDDTPLPLGKRIEKEGLDVTIFTRSEYIEKIALGEDWQTIEPLWIPDEFRWKFLEDFLPFWCKDYAKLRIAVSTIASRGHQYAKILVQKENNINLAKKNILHELRNLRLGIQIVDHGMIKDYTETKELFPLIMAENWDTSWEVINDRWRPKAMEFQKEFMAKTPEKEKKASVPKPKKGKSKTSAHPVTSSSSTTFEASSSASMDAQPSQNAE